MPALGTGCRIRAGLLGVEMVAADAMKADLAALDIIQRPIPPVVIKPQRRKQTQDQQAIQDYGDDQIRGGDHGKKFSRRSVGAKGNRTSERRHDFQGQAGPPPLPTFRQKDTRRIGGKNIHG